MIMIMIMIMIIIIIIIIYYLIERGASSLWPKVINM